LIEFLLTDTASKWTMLRWCVIKSIAELDRLQAMFEMLV
jgi:hypothetical protein